MKKLTITCQICGKIISVVEKQQIADEDISTYEEISFCTTVQADGVTLDGQSAIQVTMTQE